MFHAARVGVAARALHRSPRWPHSSLPTSPTSGLFLASSALVASAVGVIVGSLAAAAAEGDDDDDETINTTNDRLIVDPSAPPSSSRWMMPAGTTRCSCDSGVGVGVGVGGWCGPHPSIEAECCRLTAKDGPPSPHSKSSAVVVAPLPPPPGSVQLFRLFPSDDDDDDKDNVAPLRNGVLLIPDVISPGECSLLRTETDRLLERGTYCRDRNIDDDDGNGDDEDGDIDEEIDDCDDDDRLRRVSLCDMSPTARELSRRVIFERVLPTLEWCRGPSSSTSSSLCRDLGLGGWDSPDAVLEWASDEPSVNVYTAPGGRFDPHRDGYALTVIVLLSEDGAFDGGGTEFFRNGDGGVSVAAAATGPSIIENIADRADEVGGGHRRSSSKSVLVRPPRGMAVCFDGDVTHAGSPVRRGVRHLYVASFGVARDMEV